MSKKNPDYKKSPHLVISVDMPQEIADKYEARIKELKTTKKQYAIDLVLKDLGVKYVPASYVLEKEEKQISLE